MVKIRISYSKDTELKQILELLKPVLADAKIKANRDDKGIYAKIYIQLEI